MPNLQVMLKEQALQLLKLVKERQVQKEQVEKEIT